MQHFRGIALLTALLLVLATYASAQIPRTRANPGAPVEEVFWTPNVVTQSSVYNLPRGNLNVTIMHVFGMVDRGAQHLFGVDDPANVRIGIDYGMSDRLSLGFGRSRYDKIFDFRAKLNVLRQTQDGRVPLEIAVKGDLGITTMENGFAFSDRVSVLGAILFARKFSDRISIQVAPMISRLSSTYADIVAPDGEELHAAVGIGARVLLADRVALLLEVLPVVMNRSDAAQDEIALALNLETGGHVFQLFFKSSQWLNEQHILAGTTEDFLAGEFRFGFNVNRVFGTGRE
jgi:hypothetical protein